MRHVGIRPSLPQDWAGQQDASVTDRAMQTVRSATATNGTTRTVVAESALGRWPNEALQRIAARWRFCLKLNGLG
jgi:hypothetical protein